MVVLLKKGGWIKTLRDIKYFLWMNLYQMMAGFRNDAVIWITKAIMLVWHGLASFMVFWSEKG
jgi:hypothetical protein